MPSQLEWEQIDNNLYAITVLTQKFYISKLADDFVCSDGKIFTTLKLAKEHIWKLYNYVLLSSLYS